ncbi:MAG: hypothetical protein V4515_04635 [Chloroflexota bacterium]
MGGDRVPAAWADAVFAAARAEVDRQVLGDLASWRPTGFDAMRAAPSRPLVDLAAAAAAAAAQPAPRVQVQPGAWPAWPLPSAAASVQLRRAVAGGDRITEWCQGCGPRGHCPVCTPPRGYTP